MLLPMDKLVSAVLSAPACYVGIFCDDIVARFLTRDATFSLYWRLCRSRGDEITVARGALSRAHRGKITAIAYVASAE